MGNTASIHFRVLDKKEAVEKLIVAERIDHYLQECHDDRLNSLARKGIYQPNTISNPAHHTELFNAVISQIPRQLRDAGEIEIIQLMPSADGGMPHTRPPNLICYPELESGVLSEHAVQTLIHEVCHVHQRKFPLVWKTIFHALGWTEWNGTLPTRLDTHRRYNPDTIDTPLWSHSLWLPIPVFRDGTNPALADVEIWWYHTVRGYHIKNVPEAIQIKRLHPSAYEHPREITAYIISDPNRYRDTKEFQIIRQFIDL